MVKILNRKHAPAATFLHLGTFFDLKPQNGIILQRHGKSRIGWSGFDFVRQPALKIAIILADRRADTGGVRIYRCAGGQ